ncbi:MAG: LuxR C-terminal-related transcriptional regulator [Flavobacterium sp.]|uniref:LuxR C-terminal-related transcriptional regulator n=1 Tax=Flavobacterium sp. TaxID=239 RepID=UPI002B49493A|nr:LuxR C-terminal-related transcriptional regulator [Flavobacterium sp.]WRH74438.1 MAG: LuxR C-terminal-related transcriptional regulator [Flavobacterium sp.]
MRTKILKQGSLILEKELKENLETKLVNIFTVGEYYYTICNLEEGVFEYVHPSITNILGFDNDNLSYEFFFKRIHPDDVGYFLDFEQKVVDFFTSLPADEVPKYKTRFDFRIQKLDGEYIRILHQAIPIQCKDDGGVIRTLVVHTDISNLKTTNKSKLSFIGLEGVQSYIDVSVDSFFSVSKIKLTKREKEILILLANGKSSINISKELYLSKYTIDKHRNNMLLKFGTNNITELISIAINEGWI